jgi:polysaccharide biosynthesis protein PslH
MTNRPLNILQICFRMPYPLKDGGAIAMYNIVNGFYDNGCKLTLLVPITSKHSLEANDLPPDFKKMAEIYTVKINTDITFWGALKNLFTRESYYISRYIDQKFSEKLKELLKSNYYDIIHIESLKMVGYLKTIRENSTAKVVMRSHNVEFLIWQRMAQASKGVVKKGYLKLLAHRIRKKEIATLNQFDALVPITEVDGKFFKESGCRKPIFPTFTGFDFEKFKPDNSKTEPASIFHIGALDWMPNLEAIKWFMKNSWPIIHQNYPEVKFYIAGRNMPDEIRKYASENVIIIGEVENSTKFMNSKQIMVVPLLSGSGMRIKIVEGMALGKMIISTTVGAEGIGCTNLNNIMIADTALEFAEIVGILINDKNFAAKLSCNAMAFVQQNFNNHLICERLISNYRQLLK